jgi:hypothetical protein
LLAASGFQGTITLGTILIGVLVAVLFFLASMKDRQTTRWRDLYELADVERKELQHELNEARQVIADLKEQVAKLEALQMPVQVMQSLHENAEAAAARQLQILEQMGRTAEDATDRQAEVVEFLKRHEKGAEDRNQAVLGLLQLIADRLGAEPNGE